MSQVALLVGLFGIPLGLLWLGHRVRRTTPFRRRAFWGAVVGHCVAGVLALTAGLVKAETWSDGDTLRGFFGLWAMLTLPILGALLAGLRRSPRR